MLRGELLPCLIVLVRCICAGLWWCIGGRGWQTGSERGREEVNEDSPYRLGTPVKKGRVFQKQRNSFCAHQKPQKQVSSPANSKNKTSSFTFTSHLHQKQKQHPIYYQKQTKYNLSCTQKSPFVPISSPFVPKYTLFIPFSA